MIEGKEICINKGKNSENNEGIMFSEDEHNAKIHLARQRFKEFIQTYPFIYPPEATSIYNHYITKTEEKEFYKVYIYGSFLSKQKEIGELFLSSILEIFPNGINQITYEEGAEIQRGSICNLCLNTLDPLMAQYLCVICDPKHYHCEQCHNLIREGQGSSRLAHPHFLYKITKYSDKFDELRYSKDNIEPAIIYDVEPENKEHLSAGCDNRHDPENPCNGSIIGTRYKCAHCADYDFCENCEAKWHAGGTESMINTARKMKHLQSHVFIVLPFP